MKITNSAIKSRKGWALVTTVLFTALLLAISAALLSWSTTEVRVDSSHKRRLVARNAAEAVLEYGAAQAALQIQQTTDFNTTLFDPSVSATALRLPPSSLSDATNIDVSTLEVVAKVVPPPATGRFDVGAADPRNAYSSLRGLSGRDGHLTILARASSLPDPWGHRETYYIKKTITVLDGPVLQYAAFYNTDFEVAPGPDLNIYGPVHTNRDFWVSKQGSGSINFWDYVTAVGTVRKGFKVQPIQAAGTREASADYNIKFMSTSGSLVDLKGSWGSYSNVYRDQYMGTSSDQSTDFKNFTNATYGSASLPSFLQSSAHGVARRPLPGQLDNYVPDPNPTDGIIDPTFRNVPRALIERPLKSGDVEFVSNEVEKQKMARKAGLYILVNATGGPVAQVKDPTGTLISGGFLTDEYRAYVRDPDSPVSSPTYIEVRLPGQPDFGTHLGHSAPVVPAKPPRPVIKVRQRQMVDMRRFREKSSSYAAGFDTFAARSTTNVYQPKVLNIIDVDLTALKKAVDRTVNGVTTTMIFPYDSETPTDKSYYSTYRADTSEFGVNGTKTVNSVAYTRTGLPTLTNDDIIEGLSASKYWDGSIYIESIDADFKTVSAGVATTTSPAPTGSDGYPIRRDYGHRKSGVRLINGRGPIVTANATRLADATHPCGPGLTLTTNDALYILGHLNADGIIRPSSLPAAAPSASALADVTTTDASSSGNNSSLFPDPVLRSGGPSEQPLALMADAVTILSQPTFDSNWIQNGGWSDTLSYLRMNTGSYSSSWATTPPSGSNDRDGAYPSSTSGSLTATDAPFNPLPAAITDDPTTWSSVQTYRQTKWDSTDTEISAGFIIGLTPSAKHPTNSANDGQNSGGLHNLPRFLEYWGGICAIRGSMVVMFESTVAWEPFNLRVYDPPTRFWGFHNFFRNFTFSDDIPATRNLGITSGDTFQRLDRATYITERAAMWPSYTFPTPP